MNQLTGLSMKEIREYKGQNLYVLNTSDMNGREKRSMLLMTFTINGTPRTIEVPSTWIPIDLTARANIDLILQNEDFWSFLRKKAMIVVDSELAEDFLSSEDAQDEYDRVLGINSGRNDEDEGVTVDMDDRYSKQLDNNRQPLAKGNLRREEASPKVITVMRKENISTNAKLAALRNIESELTPNDFKFILKEAHNGEQEKIKQWASDKYNTMKNRIRS